MKKYYEVLNKSEQFESLPPGYLTDEQLIQLLNKKGIKIERSDNICRFANNNKIKMGRMVRVGSDGSPPTIFQKPSESKIEEILQKHKNNNNSLLGREILEKKKKKILEIFDNAQSAKEYDGKINDAPEKEKKEIIKKKWEKCETKTSIAKKVSKLMGVKCNRKLVASILNKKRSTQQDKLLKSE